MAFAQGMRRNEEVYERLRRLIAREVFAPESAEMAVLFSDEAAVGRERLGQFWDEAPVWTAMSPRGEAPVAEAAWERPQAQAVVSEAVYNMEAAQESRETSPRGRDEWTIERWLELMEQEQRRYCRPFA